MIDYNFWSPVMEISCAAADCSGCEWVHRRHTGTAEITIRGDLADVQRYADAVGPLLVEDAARA